METIIVTVTNYKKSFFYDIEIPRAISVQKLKEDLSEALNSYHPELYLKTATAIDLFCNRLNRVLRTDETIESAGVWNGDYITIIEV